MTAKQILKAQARMEKAREERTASIAILQDRTVIAAYNDATQANVKFCALLDQHFADNPNAQDHPFELQRLSVVPEIGTKPNFSTYVQ